MKLHYRNLLNSPSIFKTSAYILLVLDQRYLQKTLHIVFLFIMVYSFAVLPFSISADI